MPDLRQSLLTVRRLNFMTHGDLILSVIFGPARFVTKNVLDLSKEDALVIDGRVFRVGAK